MPYNFDWRPEIGDPTIGGWITVALYFVGCVSCHRTMVTVLSPRSSEQFDGFIWRGIAIMFFILGINKQLDLLSAFTEIGRMIAASEGWYDERRTVQFYFIIGVVALCAVALPIAQENSHAKFGWPSRDRCLWWATSSFEQHLFIISTNSSAAAYGASSGT
ncbi:hypothetical protein [Rhizobium grahamii]|uniref:hypothetical protein n=1 Tax=Rhizobium grahamii TaxID=1120045 RepID=UPI001FCBFD2E|nr:hypothetical protein [Rhizobium grahamii]